MTASTNMLLPIKLVVFVLGLFLIQELAIAKVYVYVRPDGSKLITDRKSSKKHYTLLKTYDGTSRRVSRRSSRNWIASSKPIKSQYDTDIDNIANKYGLEPPFIKAIIHVESSFDRFAISHKGAMGLMQLMPETGANYQLTRDQFNAKKNIEAGVQHMRDLMDKYSDDKKLSLAAYNAGAGAVAKYNGVPPYEETENYIAKVMNLYGKYKNQL